MSANAEAGAAGPYLTSAAALGFLDVWFRHEPARGIRKVERALARYPMDSLKPLDRPYLSLAYFYASAGEPQRARALLTEYERLVEPSLRRGEEPWRHSTWGYVNVTEGRFREAIDHFRAYALGAGGCLICGLAELGRTYDRVDEPDSAFAYYQRYVATPVVFRVSEDATELAGIYKRLGELHEARGDRAKAREYYGRFADLWSECDPELRPAVTEVRRRLAQLSQEPPS
jgi:tetratricopeptide (TPR) repeat protein